MDVNNVIQLDIKNVMELLSVNLVSISKMMDPKNVLNVMLEIVPNVLTEKTVMFVSLDSVYTKILNLQTLLKKTTNVLPVIHGV
jgi:hypothetical protein